MKLNDLKQKALEFLKDKENNEIVLSEPLFRLENNKLYLGYLLLNFTNDYKIKRPTKWLLQDMFNGNIIEFNNIVDKDFTTIEQLPLDTLFEDKGTSTVYEDFNNISISFSNWMKSTKEKLNNSNTYNESILKIDDNLINPKEFILANSDSVFNEMFDVLFNKLGKLIEEGNKEYQSSLFEEIRNNYSNNIIDKELIKKYVNLNKYLFPETIKLINSFNNIHNTEDIEYDNKLIKQ